MRTDGEKLKILEKEVVRLSDALRIAEQMLKAYEFKYPDTKQLLVGYKNKEAMDVISKARANELV